MSSPHQRLAITKAQLSAPSQTPTKPSPTADIVVVGSCFIDYITYAPRTPAAGETMHSDHFQKGFGGKGANQCVMSAILGSSTSMVSALGDDGDGRDYENRFHSFNIDTSLLMHIPGQSSGLTLINVNSTTGQNQIVICPNATKELLMKTSVVKGKHSSVTPPPKLHEALQAVFERAQKQKTSSHRPVLICQNEIPLLTSLESIKLAHEVSQGGIYTIFNSAPAPSAAEVPTVIPYLKHVSLFCPNENEASQLTGIQVTDDDPSTAVAACSRLQELGVRDVVITLGKRGYMLAESGCKPEHYPASKLPDKVVDTTGAGDCFVGALAHYVAKGIPLKEACTAANVCAGRSVCRKGTQTSYPMKNELPAALQQL